MNTRSFVNSRNITITSEYASTNPNMADENWQANHYKVTLHNKRRQLTTYFSMGVGLTREPSAEDVIDSLASDAAGYENARSFEEWASEYGYDTDSRKAERTFNIIGRQVNHLKRFLGDDYETLLWKVERL
jgi:hypothetical protein